MKIQTGEDLFLKTLTQKYLNKKYSSDSNYFSLFEIEDTNLNEKLIWLHGLSRNISIPNWLSIVANYEWSCLYTSAIDDVIFRAFRSEWRKVSRISNKKINPLDSTNRRNLHCIYLFGSIIDTNENEIPPLNEEKYGDRLADEAYPLLTRINQHITPLGTLVVEGYDPDNDMLKSDSFKRVIKKLMKGQTFLFSANKKIRDNPHINSLIKNGKIIAFEEPLYHILKEGSEEGLIQLGTIPNDDESSIFIDFANKSHNIPSNLWRKISNYAEVLDCSKFLDLERKNQNELEAEFQDFLANSSRNPIWSGYNREFAFSRDYGKKLTDLVLTSLKSRIMDECPIILHGQTGSGKTIILQKLAFCAGKLKYPVLYISGVPSLLENMKDAIDEFCQWAENERANKTLIIWDGMVSPFIYQRIFNLLSNRGRKIVLVGSCYRVTDDILNSSENELESNFKLIEAPISFTEYEIEHLSEHFSKFYPNFNEIMKKHRPELMGDNFLVFLYRLLPSSRSILHVGIATETEQAESNIRKRAKISKLSFGNLLFSQALTEAGYIEPDQKTEEHLVQNYLNSDVFSKLLQYVMVPGRLGEKVPLSIVQRTIKSQDYQELLEILEYQDIFSILEESDGNFFISPRHALEAKLLCEWRFGGPNEEINHCLDLFDNIYCWNAGTRYLTDEEIELKFLLEMVKKIGPNGPERKRYKLQYRKIFEKLAELRKTRSIKLPGLILQEANLAREYIIANHDIEDIFNETENILNNSIKLLEDTLFELRRIHYRNYNMLDQMTVELAANKSSMIIHSVERGNYDDLLKNISSIHDNLDKVLNRSVNDEHALDIYGWSTIKLINSSSLNEIERTEIITRALKVIEIGELSAFGINDTILVRKSNLLQSLGKYELSKEIFDSLKQKGSRIGYLRYSIEHLSKISTDKTLSKSDTELCREVHQFLERDRQFIKEDLGCLYQLLKSWWMMKTGSYLFKKENERQAVPFNQNDWSYCIGIFDDMRLIKGLENDPSMMYLYGITLFHKEFYEMSERIFRSIAHQDISTGKGGGRRIIKYYLASNEDGTPRVYTGKVSTISHERNEGYIYVDDFHRTVKFFPRDFKDQSLREGDQIEPFHIGFNFINIVADPTSYYKGNRRMG